MPRPRWLCRQGQALGVGHRIGAMHPENPVSDSAILRKIKVGGSAWAVALAVLGLLAVPAAHAQTVWMGGSDANWFTAGNWNPAAVPTGGGDVEINTNSGPQPVISGNVAAANNIYVGYDSSSGGNTLLTIQATGNLVSNGNAYIGYNATASGGVKVDGANTSWNLGSNNIFVGEGGNGTLTISNGAGVTSHNSTIGDQTGSNGLVNIVGANSNWNVGGSFTVGDNGVGSLFVLNGGNVGVAGLVTVGIADGSHGSVVVDGANSKFNVGGDLYLGFRANSNLTISNGGSITSTQGELGVFGGSATVLVTGANSTWNMGSGSFSVGELAQANLTIANGGNVTSTGVILGGFPGGGASVLVTGVGSVWNTGVSSPLIVGKGGAANLTIENGGLVNANEVILSNSGGSAQLNINAGAILQISGANSLHAGSGNYTLTLGGGIVRLTSADFTTSLNATLAPGTASTIDTNGFNATFAGTLSGGGSLIKAGNGTLNLNGGNSYSGNTSITGGKLNVGGNINVPSGVTLQINGNLVATNVLVNAGGTVTGNGTITGNLVNNGSVTLNSGTGQRLTIQGNLTNNGLVSLLNGSGLSVSGAATNGASAIVDDTTGAVPTFGSFANAGVFVAAHDVPILNVQNSESSIVVSLQTYPGHNYQLQSCPDLTKAQWVNVGAPVPGTGSILNFSDGLVFFTSPLLFYRVVVAP